MICVVHLSVAGPHLLVRNISALKCEDRKVVTQTLSEVHAHVKA